MIMGLFEQAARLNIDTDLTANKKKSGLLKRIRDASGYDAICDSFRDFLSSVNAERGGILIPSEEGALSLSFSSGFDFTSTKRFLPLIADFADLIPSDGWFSFTGSELEKFSPYFSSHERESLSAVFIRRVEYSQSLFCYILLADSLLDIQRLNTDIKKADILFPDMESTLKDNSTVISVLYPVSTVNKSYEAIKLHAESALASKNSATLITLSCAGLFHDTEFLQTDAGMLSIYNAIVHRIAKQTGSSNIVHAGNDAILRIALFTSLPVTDIDFYFYQLMKPLEKIFGMSRISRLVVTTTSSSSSVEEILDFLTGEN